MAEQRRGFLETGSSHLSVFEVLPAQPAQGSILFAPPFAEEMNRGRRIAAQLGRRLASRGYHWISFDWSGTGESSGSLTDATADQWVDELLLVGREALKLPYPVSGVIGLRFGALMAAAVAARTELAQQVVLWQPVLSGRQQIRELISQRALSERLRGTGNAPSAVELHASLDAGNSIELGGYVIERALARSMDQLDLGTLLEQLEHLPYWVEVERGCRTPAEEETREAATRYPPSRKIQTPGPAFWLQPEGPFPEEALCALEDIFPPAR